MKTFKVVLSDKELNYLDAGLRDSIGVLESYGAVGNGPHLLWFTKRLRGKLKRIHYPPRGTPKSTPEIRAIIRKAKKNAKSALAGSK